MSKAFEIAQERFAKGEIAKEEYDSIVQSLSQGSAVAEEKPAPQPAANNGSGAGVVGVIILIFVLIFILMIVWSGLKIGMNA